MRYSRWFALAAGLALLAPGMARAQATYKIQPIVKQGDTVGDVRIATSADFEIGALNDAGQFIFVTENGRPTGSELLFQYENGKLTPIVVRSQDAPGGKWPPFVYIPAVPVSMNQRGNAVFPAPLSVGDRTHVGLFLWDHQAQKVTSVALKGMPLANDLTFTESLSTPTLNNSDEIAFAGAVKNPIGKRQNGIFFRGRDGKVQLVGLQDQDLPGAGKLLGADFFAVGVNDEGMVAFLARRQGDDGDSAYVWEKGTLTPLAVVDADAPGGGAFATVTAVRLNNKNRNLLVAARLKSSGPDVLYRYADGKLTPVVAPGQEMPGGGKFKTIPTVGGPGFASFLISYANELGQVAFIARLEDGATGAYLMDADGKLSLILKSGTSTDLGQVTQLGLIGSSPATVGVALNSKGQVVLTVRIDNSPQTVVLLTPTAQ